MTLPEVMPVLSAGKHRNPRKGACFMEFASYLAGERWSDHPSCTHPLLASVARQVNDALSDTARTTIAELIPRVIGLTGSDRRIDAVVAMHAAGTALPLAPMSHQRVLAVGILACESMLDGTAWASPSQAERCAYVRRYAHAALADVPDAMLWARQFSRFAHAPARRFRTDAAPTIIQVAIEGIQQACLAESLLVELLEDAIIDCETLCATTDQVLPTPPPATTTSARSRLGELVGR